METAANAPAGAAPGKNWSLWQRILFRFFFVYLILQVAPWNWFRAIPGVSFALRFYYIALDWAVRAGNARFFHVRPVLIEQNGSGDTSYAYAEIWLYLSIAVIACVLWSVLDRKRREYDRP